MAIPKLVIPVPSRTPTRTPTPTPKIPQIRSDAGCVLVDNNLLSPTPTRTQTRTPTQSRTPKKSQTPTPTKTPTITPTITTSVTVTPTRTPTRSITPTLTSTPTASITRTPTTTASNTATPTTTPTNTPTPTTTPTTTPSITASLTPSITVSVSPTITPSITTTATPTLTPSRSATPTPTPTITVSQSPTNTPTITPSLSPINCCEWDGNTFIQFDATCNNLVVPVKYTKVSNYRWTASGVLSCGDTFNSVITCDPDIRYTGPSSCINKWTSSLTISCVSGLIITGIKEVCQCNAPPIWSFIGDFTNCNCCTPTPSMTPTRTVTPTVTATPTQSPTRTITPSPSKKTCCDWNGFTTFVLNCLNVDRTISVNLLFTKVMPNYWTSSGTLPCGDTYFMSITCDPSVPYTGAESCSNKWTATANITCVGGLTITGISTACQCDVPPIWNFTGNTNNCGCCTPPPSQTPTPTPTPNCSLAAPIVSSADCSCSVQGGLSGQQFNDQMQAQASLGNGTYVTVTLNWQIPQGVNIGNGRAYGTQACMQGYQIQVLDSRGEAGSGLVGGIVDNICIFNNLTTTYQYYMSTSQIIRGDGTCINLSPDSRALTFRIRSIHFDNCQQAYFDSWSNTPSIISSSWASFPGTYCFESCCITPTPTPTQTITPSITASQTVTPTITVSLSVSPTITVSSSTTPTVTPSNTPEPTPSSTPAPTPSRTPDPTPPPTPPPTPDPTPDPTPPPSYYVYAESIIKELNYLP